MYNLPRITKQILGINCVVWILDILLRGLGFYLPGLTGLYPMWSDNFHIWQPFTYMWMHAGFGHLFCNMFAVLMFGPALEREWGEKKFLIYYLVCGIGAALVQELVWYLTGANPMSSTIGASGAVFGVLLAFGWLFPDVEMFLLFIPIPIRSRVFVIGYAFFELLAGLTGSPFDNVAHFAHLGGMLFGALLLAFWTHQENHKNDEQDADYSGYHYQKRL